MKKIVSCLVGLSLTFNISMSKNCFAVGSSQTEKSASFSFLDLGSVVQFLSFEKNPRSFIESKYKLPVTILKALGIAASGILGGLWGHSIANKEDKDNEEIPFETDESVDARSKSKEEVQSKKSLGAKLSKFFYVALFAIPGAGSAYNLTSWASLSFLNGKVSNLECEKNAKTLAIKSLLRQIKDSSWKAFDSLLIRLHLVPENFDGNTAFRNTGANFTAEEQANLETEFSQLSQNLTNLIKKDGE